MNFISLLPLREAESDSHVRTSVYERTAIAAKKNNGWRQFQLYTLRVSTLAVQIYFTFTPAVYWADKFDWGSYVFRQSQTDATQQTRPFDVMYLLQHESLVTNK